MSRRWWQMRVTLEWTYICQQCSCIWLGTNQYIYIYIYTFSRIQGIVQNWLSSKLDLMLEICSAIWGIFNEQIVTLQRFTLKKLCVCQISRIRFRNNFLSSFWDLSCESIEFGGSYFVEQFGPDIFWTKQVVAKNVKIWQKWHYLIY